MAGYGYRYLRVSDQHEAILDHRLSLGAEATLARNVDVRLGLVVDLVHSLLPKPLGVTTGVGLALQVDWRLRASWRLGPRFAIATYADLGDSPVTGDSRPTIGVHARNHDIILGIDMSHASHRDSEGQGLVVVAGATVTGRPGKYALLGSAITIPIAVLAGFVIVSRNDH